MPYSVKHSHIEYIVSVVERRATSFALGSEIRINGRSGFQAGAGTMQGRQCRHTAAGIQAQGILEGRWRMAFAIPFTLAAELRLQMRRLLMEHVLGIALSQAARRRMELGSWHRRRRSVVIVAPGNLGQALDLQIVGGLQQRGQAGL